ncbi:hypothetical protein OG978_30850 [Streptomyces sp. NBC_01591]|uniref:hypothetical protein n=1 Tax=Streptomyces sp. NBC_01591 TaxID=2975888 RepID=UPI002DD83C78|nr:hypothetical protein [Streptomyces sp. NBC_01591]WSD71397.1 hypothetical protein OG978_30850 [Streptomyces sp. NBC_01591]
MVAVALVHSTALMVERLPENPPAWLHRGERTFAYPHKDWRKPRVWCLAFFTDRHTHYERRRIIGVGSVFPGRRSGTYERALITRDFTTLQLPLPLVDLEGAMGASRRYLRDDGRLSPAAGDKLLDAVRRQRPELNETLDGLENSLGANPPTGEVGERLSLEKDAVGTLLEAFGADRDPLEAWQPPLGENDPRSRYVPFLEGLPALRQIEDQQIVHDYMRFPGMASEDAVQVGWRIYRRNSDSPHRLFVYNANRTHAETVMGVDMIYVNEHARSVATVQYKRMRQSGRSWVYWHDGTGERELDRMKAVDDQCRAEDELARTSQQSSRPLGDPRLVTTPSMVKLCRTVPFMMNSAALIPGMYLARQHFRELLQRPESDGPSGGKRIIEDSVPRYLNNTTFTTLLRDGWIGTRDTSWDYIIDLIRESLSPGGPGSVVVGMHRSEVAPGNRRVN